MPDAKQLQFGQRLRRIDKHHRKLSKGYVNVVGPDGLIVARPRRKGSFSPLRGVFLCLLTLLAFKGFMLAQLGPTAYQDRLERLQTGSVVERIGGFALTADPVTIWIADQVRPFIR